ncbi:IS66-like element accessory protein TnpA [Ideonella dechloratans]|jgi:transposase|uniref:IS66-like element accessory protein TnpA n=1 Tax=Ideonella dechloratans TaxID=36863 RepID=UPI0035B2E5E2
MQACGHTPIWSGERVLRTNARGRHTYVDEFKHWIVEQALQPGMSLAGLAMSNQVNANQLRRWVQLHSKRPGAVAAAARLVPVTLASASPPVPAPLREVAVEIVVGNALVRVRDGVSPASLRTVLACLRDTTL